MENRLLIKMLEVLADEGIPLSSFIRDLKIRDEYFSKIKDNPKINKRKLRMQLSSKYYIGVKTVEAAIYGYKNKRQENA